VVSYNPLQFFLKEPDKVFIIVKEVEMQPYFKRALLYNYLFQLYLIVLVAAVIGPMYQHLYADKGTNYYLFIVLLMLLLKGWNMWMNWYMMRIHNPTVRHGDKVIRILYSTTRFYCFYRLVFSQSNTACDASAQAGRTCLGCLD